MPPAAPSSATTDAATGADAPATPGFIGRPLGGSARRVREAKKAREVRDWQKLAARNRERRDHYESGMTSKATAERRAEEHQSTHTPKEHQ